MKLKLLSEDITMLHRLRAAVNRVRDGGDSAKVWYHPVDGGLFISVGDSADPTPLVNALIPIVGKGNIECEPESGPSGDGWVVVGDTHRIKDNFGTMTPERLVGIGEGVDADGAHGQVGAARRQIMNIVNDIARKVARSVQAIFGDRALVGAIGMIRPQVEFADSEENPAVVTIRLGSGSLPETISITIFGDGAGETRLEMSERLSELLRLSRYTIASSLREVNAKLSEVVVVMKQKLGRSPSNVQNNY